MTGLQADPNQAPVALWAARRDLAEDAAFAVTPSDRRPAWVRCTDLWFIQGRVSLRASGASLTHHSAPCRRPTG